MLIELGQNSAVTQVGAARDASMPEQDLHALLQSGRRDEVAGWIRQRYRLDAPRAATVARLLSHGLPAQVQDGSRHWLTFCLSQGSEAAQQHTLLEGMRSLTMAGRSAEAAAWYGGEFEASEELSWEAVSLLGGRSVRAGEPRVGSRRRRGSGPHPGLLLLLLTMALISLILGIAMAMVLS